MADKEIIAAILAAGSIKSILNMSSMLEINDNAEFSVTVYKAVLAALENDLVEDNNLPPERVGHI